jgi:hypothetical protein
VFVPSNAHSSNKKTDLSEVYGTWVKLKESVMRKPANEIRFSM